MSDAQDAIRRIAWRDLFPWLILFRVFGLSIAAPLLLLGTLGAVLAPVGWRVARVVFLSKADRSGPAEEFHRFVSRWPGAGNDAAARHRVPSTIGELLSVAGEETRGDLETVFGQSTAGFRALFDGQHSVRQLAYLAFGCLWTVLVWGFFGGAITRIAVVHLGREERVHLRPALNHAARNLLAYFAAPLCPLIVVSLIVILSLPVGWLMRADVGVVVAALIWPLTLVGGVILALLLGGLLYGWPLMTVAISAERHGDVFEAAQRSYAYAYGRPFAYLAYAILALAIGSLGAVMVRGLTEGTVASSRWAVSWGAGATRADQLFAMVDAGQASAVDAAILSSSDARSGRDASSEPSASDSPQSDSARADSANSGRSSALALGVWLIGLLTGIVRAVAVGFAHSYFWCAASAIYLLLRQNVDEAEFDQVFLEGEDFQYSLPPLRRDEAGPPMGTDESGST